MCQVRFILFLLAYDPLKSSNINPCNVCQNTTCQNRGHCSPTLGTKGFACTCASAFTGDYCEERVERCYVNACLHDGECINKPHNGFKIEIAGVKLFCLFTDDWKKDWAANKQ